MRKQSRRFFFNRNLRVELLTRTSIAEQLKTQGTRDGQREPLLWNHFLTRLWMDGTTFITSSFALQNTPALQTNDLVVSGCGFWFLVVVCGLWFWFLLI